MGATGARMIATAMGIMKKGDKAVVSMCVGIGMGVAAVLEYEG
jgi:acetyl-CoA acetyltransferase